MPRPAVKLVQAGCVDGLYKEIRLVKGKEVACHICNSELDSSFSLVRIMIQGVR
jgi:hypothetical protein